MPKITIRYIVDDTEDAIDFYTRYLGFRVYMHPAPGFAALDLGNLRLLLNQPGAGGAGQRMTDGRTPEPGGWNRLQLPVRDLERRYRDLKKKGVSLRSDLISGKGGKQLILEDSSGNPVELFEPADNKPDQNAYKPEEYSNVIPYLAIQKADNLVGFIRGVFDAEEHRLWRWEDGSFMHGEFRIGDSLIMIGDVQDRFDPFPGMLYVYVPDVDQTYRKAIELGAESVEKPADQDYGDRRAAFSDPTGNKWYVASRITNKN